MKHLRSNLLFTALVIASSCFAQEKSDIDFGLPKIKGKVKSLIEICDTSIDPSGYKRSMLYKREYSYNELSKCTSRTDYPSKGISNTTKCFYDAKGFKIKEEGYNVSKGPNANGVRNDYKYDDKGNLIEAIYIDPIDSKTIIKYNEKGDVIEKRQFAPDSIKSLKAGWTVKNAPSMQIYKNTYNEKGQLAECTIYVKDTLYQKCVYKYDARGNKVEYEVMTPEGKLWSKVTYGYDEKDRENEEVWYNNKGEISFHRFRKFDEYCNSILDRFYRNDGSISAEYTTTYQYDKFNNWTEQTETTSKGTYINKRIIEYY